MPETKSLIDDVGIRGASNARVNPRRSQAQLRSQASFNLRSA